MRWWIKLTLAVLLIGILLFAVVQIGGVTWKVVRSFIDGDSAERDPMFAEEAERVTPPPELYPDEGGHRFEDRSADWDTSVQTPVDQTAEELERLEREKES